MVSILGAKKTYTIELVIRGKERLLLTSGGLRNYSYDSKPFANLYDAIATYHNLSGETLRREGFRQDKAVIELREYDISADDEKVIGRKTIVIEPI